MGISQPRNLIRYLRNSLAVRTDGTDGQLLTEFVERRDDVAFDALVHRHGPMVLGVCQRILGHEQDAEDAFQATFLVLIRKASSVKPREMIANWLYGVAHNTALKSRSLNMRRERREREVARIVERDSKCRSGDLWKDLKPLLDQELSRLPDKYRVPIVLCDLEGKGHHEAARQLGWPAGTLSGRLSRARALLARRLGRHCLLISTGVLAAVLSENAASAFLRPSLASLTVRAAMLSLTGPTATGGIVSPKVAALVKGVLRVMLLTKLSAITAVFVTLGFVATGGLATYQRIAAQRTTANADMQGEAGMQQASAGRQAKPDQDAEAGPRATKGTYKQEGKVDEKETGPDSKVRLLQTERLAVLKEIAADKNGRFQQGHASPNDALQANVDVLKAELELADSDDARIRVLAQMVEIAKQLEDISDVQFKAGRCPLSDRLSAKANRLEAQIKLERAKVRAARKPK